MGGWLQALTPIVRSGIVQVADDRPIPAALAAASVWMVVIRLFGKGFAPILAMLASWVCYRLAPITVDSVSRVPQFVTACHRMRSKPARRTMALVLHGAKALAP
jgi:hypothetical protein